MCQVCAFVCECASRAFLHFNEVSAYACQDDKKLEAWRGIDV